MSVNRRLLISRLRKMLLRYPRIWQTLKVLQSLHNAGFRASTLLLNTFYYSRYGNIIVHPNTRITGGGWLSISGTLTVGVSIRLLMHPSDRTIVDLHGDLCTRGDVSIGKGCRIWVGEGARCELEDCYISGNTLAFIRHGLTIGAGSAISWGCQFLDDDWNTVHYPNQRVKPPQITIGRHVWIGSNVSLLKGVSVGDGCVVASGSVLTRSYPAGCLIGGNPARILRESIHWGKDAVETPPEAPNAAFTAPVLSADSFSSIEHDVS